MTEYRLDHYFNNNDNYKINYLSSSMPLRDQVIYASILNVTRVNQNIETSV